LSRYKHRANCLGRTFLTEESPGFAAQLLLVVGEIEIHVGFTRVEAGQAIGA
jgi:hypothetical protein